MHANHGYLVKVADGTSDFTLQTKGRPVLPEVRWHGDGIHLAGFPVLATGTTPTFANYLAPTGFALAQAEILRYNGGPTAPDTNPLALNPTVSRITRGAAPRRVFHKANPFGLTRSDSEPVSASHAGAPAWFPASFSSGTELHRNPDGT